MTTHPFWADSNVFRECLFGQNTKVPYGVRVLLLPQCERLTLVQIPLGVLLRLHDRLGVLELLRLRLVELCADVRELLLQLRCTRLCFCT
jgi:hypothetical protein